MAQLNWVQALADLGPDATFRIFNSTPADPNRYLFLQLLPEVNLATWKAKEGSMTISTTMAQLTGRDENYRPVGAMSARVFEENLAKVTGYFKLDENSQIEIEQFVTEMLARSQDPQAYLRNVLLNFNKMILQAHRDTSEYHAGRALTKGALSYVNGDISIDVDYQRPAANTGTQRSGTDHYGGSTSKYWADRLTARQTLKRAITREIMTRNTFEMIYANDVNRVALLQDGQNQVRIGRESTTDDTRVDNNQRYLAQITIVDAEFEVLDPTQPSGKRVIPSMDDGDVLYIAQGGPSNSFNLGQGSTPGEDQAPDTSLGYTHIGKTIEGGTVGRWGRQYVPEKRQYEFITESASNELPVVLRPELTYLARTDMA